MMRPKDPDVQQRHLRQIDPDVHQRQLRQINLDVQQRQLRQIDLDVQRRLKQRGINQCHAIQMGVKRTRKAPTRYTPSKYNVK
ncbi:hypothetical protein V6N13_088537 [Hibiscus sabdariffa]